MEQFGDPTGVHGVSSRFSSRDFKWPEIGLCKKKAKENFNICIHYMNTNWKKFVKAELNMISSFPNLYIVQ